MRGNYIYPWSESKGKYKARSGLVNMSPFGPILNFLSKIFLIHKNFQQFSSSQKIFHSKFFSRNFFTQNFFIFSRSGLMNMSPFGPISNLKGSLHLPLVSEKRLLYGQFGPGEHVSIWPDLKFLINYFSHSQKFSTFFSSQNFSHKLFPKIFLEGNNYLKQSFLGICSVSPILLILEKKN